MGISNGRRWGVAIPTALFLVMVMFTLATVTLQRTAHDMRFAKLSAERTRKHYLARAGVATVLARLNSPDGGSAGIMTMDEFDSKLNNLPANLYQGEIDGYTIEVNVHSVEGSLETLRFEGKAYPINLPGAAGYHSVTVVKQHKNDPVLVAKTAEFLDTSGGNNHKLAGIFYLRESAQSSSGDKEWTPLPPAPAYDYGGGLLGPGRVIPARRIWHVQPNIPAWLLTQPTFDQTGKFYVQFQNILSVLRSKNVIYVYDINAGAGDSPNEISDTWKVLPPIPPPDASDLPVPENLQDLFLNATLGLPSVLGQISVDGSGRVVVGRHGLRTQSLWRFTPTIGAPFDGPMIQGSWEEIPAPHGLPNPALMSPVTDDEGNIYALWGDSIINLVDRFLRNPDSLINPDQMSGEIELGTIDGLNTVYRFDGETEQWTDLGQIPDMVYAEKHGSLVVEDRGIATNIAGISVGQSGEIYALVINHDGPDSMLKYAGGRWHLLPPTPARDPASGEADSEDLADFNNFALDSRMRLYGKDPNLGRDSAGVDTIYRYKGGRYQTVNPITEPPLNHNLQRSGTRGPQPIHQLGGGGILTDAASYQFIPIASY